MGSETRALQQSSVCEPLKSATIVSPTESEIAALAYQLWLDSGCRVGSSQENWFRAEELLKNALAAQCEGLSRRPSISRDDNCSEFEMVVGFRWDGHWEAWESEWSEARWTWDEVSRCAG
jgi:hypothetical protein